MALTLILIIITILCGSAVYKEFKSQNIFGVSLTGLSTILFGFLSVTTII
ncbi:hypothetical protein GCM10011351_17220 [Paraliobacillus quinghaiensis]|uniref:DUF2759 domain-containing protein n=1 Tax=Paraliobacillus quinghaiensis TaxID=470815 RepID=A0A917TPB5_9BACI|nr:DUF2759 family protein [Paraliobacillus quinghaiensis]GGM31589.1 hypothetical protein GCM10011351_17220 [Paraliobacillus quinghaiensis]